MIQNFVLVYIYCYFILIILQKSQNKRIQLQYKYQKDFSLQNHLLLVILLTYLRQYSIFHEPFIVPIINSQRSVYLLNLFYLLMYKYQYIYFSIQVLCCKLLNLQLHRNFFHKLKHFYSYWTSQNYLFYYFNTINYLHI